jgi:hypothetical protein
MASMNIHCNPDSHFTGYKSQIRCYIAEHALLVIHFQHPDISTLDRYLLCGFCTTLPQRIHWTVKQLVVTTVSENRHLVTDCDAGVSFVCDSIVIRDSFDLRRYLAVENKTS